MEGQATSQNKEEAGPKPGPHLQGFRGGTGMGTSSVPSHTGGPARASDTAEAESAPTATVLQATVRLPTRWRPRAHPAQSPLASTLPSWRGLPPPAHPLEPHEHVGFVHCTSHTVCLAHINIHRRMPSRARTRACAHSWPAQMALGAGTMPAPGPRPAA